MKRLTEEVERRTKKDIDSPQTFEANNKVLIIQLPAVMCYRLHRKTCCPENDEHTSLKCNVKAHY